MGISVEIYRVVLLFHCFQIQLLNFITIIKTKPSGAIKRAGLCEERANIFFLSVTFIHVLCMRNWSMRNFEL